MKHICLLGATGSIGQSTLDVIALNPAHFRLEAVSGHQRLDRLFEICQQFQPRYAGVPEAACAAFATRLRRAGLTTEVVAGAEGLASLASHPDSDTVVAGIVGAAGLLPSLAAARAGKRLLLANKEALVMAGKLFMDEVAQNNALLLPVDSEHNAIFQCLPANFAHRDLQDQGIERLLLTASGGPFRGWDRQALQQVTPAQAIAHPNWSMGAKISVDSATLMNKGLELIEACWLFGVQPHQIQVLIHPQSLVHSMVQYKDGSLLAQLGNPDMKTPIAHALAWPDRIPAGVAALDLLQHNQLTFEAPDETSFPCLNLARQAFLAGGTLPAVLNAANEVAVTGFLQGRLRFTAIAEILDQVLNLVTPYPVNQLDDILSEDRRIRQLTLQLINRQAD